MSENKLTYEDIKEFENLFTLAPPLILKGFARKKTNFVSKFKSKVEEFLNDLTDEELNKLDIILNTDTDELQSLMADAYNQSGKKQYKILADPKNKEFIEINLDELREMVEE